LGRRRLAVMPERLSVVETEEAELMATDVGLKLRVGM
jgi:hypothetical protein